MDGKGQLYYDVGQRLRKWRRHNECTQEKMAELLEMSLTFYSKIERGKSGLSIEKLVLLHEKLEVDITYLLTGDASSIVNLDAARGQMEALRYLRKYLNRLHEEGDL